MAPFAFTPCLFEPCLVKLPRVSELEAPLPSISTTPGSERPAPDVQISSFAVGLLISLFVTFGLVWLGYGKLTELLRSRDSGKQKIRHVPLYQAEEDVTAVKDLRPRSFDSSDEEWLFVAPITSEQTHSKRKSPRNIFLTQRTRSAESVADLESNASSVPDQHIEGFAPDRALFSRIEGSDFEVVNVTTATKQSKRNGAVSPRKFMGLRSKLNFKASPGKVIESISRHKYGRISAEMPAPGTSPYKTGGRVTTSDSSLPESLRWGRRSGSPSRQAENFCPSNYVEEGKDFEDVSVCSFNPSLQ